MNKLPENEIKQRLQKLYNYEKVMYPRMKQRSDKVRKENFLLKEKIKQLEKEFLEEREQTEKILLELEELREIIYGKTQQARKKEKVPLPAKDSRKGGKPIPRPAESYRRAEPKAEDVTGEIRFDISECSDCGNELKDKKEHINYREDLQDLEMLLKNAKKVTKRIIESGYCIVCKKRKTTKKIPKQTVEIGQNVKATIVYLHILLGLSYREIREHLKSSYGFDISDGMISKSLEEQADILRSFYGKIYNDLLQENGCHYDESSWDIQGEGEGNYVWVKTGTESEKTIFWFGKSRGKGVAEKLRGDLKEGNVKNQVGISDDYGAYRNMFPHQELCWAHPNRKLRDLAESSVLKNDIRKHCDKVFRQFAKLYRLAEKERGKFNADQYKTAEEKAKAKKVLIEKFDKITEPHEKDPHKLKQIRSRLAKRKDRYFTFLEFKGIPLDNNKAERALRRVVLKRKKTFGSRTQKGANNLSILYSSVFSIYWSNPPDDFFQHYTAALNFQADCQ